MTELNQQEIAERTLENMKMEIIIEPSPKPKLLSSKCLTFCCGHFYI